MILGKPTLGVSPERDMSSHSLLMPPQKIRPKYRAVSSTTLFQCGNSKHLSLTNELDGLFLTIYKALLNPSFRVPDSEDHFQSDFLKSHELEVLYISIIAVALRDYSQKPKTIPYILLQTNHGSGKGCGRKPKRSRRC